MSRKAKIILGFVPLFIIFVIVFWFSSNNADDSSMQSGRVVSFIRDLFFPSLKDMESPRDFELVTEILTVIVRKGAHFTIYLCMGISAFGGLWFMQKRKLRYSLAVGICFLYAISDEIHQHFVPGRSCEARDVIIDTCGAALGALICLFIVWVKFLKKRNAQLESKLEQQTQE